ncbi:hypothetical protein Q1695_004220 [Nippostrongylus brasiliensis]|nr:hypothetical protein Q1695_004220 [Nippostrongylus brasiliensis]
MDKSCNNKRLICEDPILQQYLCRFERIASKLLAHGQTHHVFYDVFDYNSTRPAPPLALVKDAIEKMKINARITRQIWEYKQTSSMLKQHRLSSIPKIYLL